MKKFDHISRHHAVTKNVVQNVLLTFLVALSLSLVGASTAFASTKPRPPKPPNYVTVQCLEESAYIAEYKDNQAHGTGESYNNCLATLVIYQIIGITSSCPGYGTGSGTINTDGSTFAGNSFIQDIGANAGCVVCKYRNGYLYETDYPDFTLNMTVTASGGFTYHATSNTASDHVLFNNSGLYAPSCPPTG